VAADPVNSVAVKAVLVSFDFRRKDCDNVGRFAQTMSKQMSWLLQNGHPKWKAVDLNYPLKGWEAVRLRAEVHRHGRRGSRGRHQAPPRRESGLQRDQGTSLTTRRVVSGGNRFLTIGAAAGSLASWPRWC